ncbi:RrF2 family transcriptional regulator [Saccharibacillus endophyticus]|uniref:Rrf2 family transcriptional regulator n=1 Tax=Saccharibacillus endophyticus TaxID=2060666 RepID=A0ABQ2A222_9BACL|nr:Rrf2 family transcriptional regulator [Saccharibacillus endophyticus]GGH84189.1 hypothetical protein GCM10007362_38660 [Saccharibacillus endophyticus]
MKQMAYSTALSQATAILIYAHGLIADGCSDYLSTRLISEQLSIPVPTTVKVLRSLTDAGLIRTKEGAKGGILPAKPPEQITLLEVFDAVESGKALFKVHTDVALQGEATDTVKFKLTESLRQAETAMRDSLEKVKLNELLG